MKKIIITVFILSIFLVGCSKTGYLEVTNSTGGYIDLEMTGPVESYELPLQDGEVNTREFNLDDNFGVVILSYSMIEESVEIYKNETTRKILTVSPCPDSRFIGDWSCSKYGEYFSSIHEWAWHSYSSYTFENNNKIFYYSAHWEYGVEDYNSPYMSYREWKKEGTKYYERLWHNDYDPWKEWNIQINSSGDLLEIHYEPVIDWSYTNVFIKQ